MLGYTPCYTVQQCERAIRRYKFTIHTYHYERTKIDSVIMTIGRSASLDGHYRPAWRCCALRARSLLASAAACLLHSDSWQGACVVFNKGCFF
jgi:hypothetical protein